MSGLSSWLTVVITYWKARFPQNSVTQIHHNNLFSFIQQLQLWCSIYDFTDRMPRPITWVIGDTGLWPPSWVCNKAVISLVAMMAMVFAPPSDLLKIVCQLATVALKPHLLHLCPVLYLYIQYILIHSTFRTLHFVSLTRTKTHCVLSTQTLHRWATQVNI